MSASATKGASRIVVGVDESAPSRAALRWAVRQAALTGGTVDAVLAWQIPAVPQGYGWVPVFIEQEGNFAEEASKQIDTVISEEVRPADSQRVTSQVVQGLPAQVLIDAAAGADLLVVGSRGHGGFTEALLGSVGQHCVHHAPCPVLIMRGDPSTADAA